MADYDDGAYYEVQLNNKQLVFFFMAALAIAVVVFLCGVMVGRGVRDATLAASRNDISASVRTTGQPVEAQNAGAAAPRLDYSERLEADSVRAKLDVVRSESPETTSRERGRTPEPEPEPEPAAPTPPAPKPPGASSSTSTPPTPAAAARTIGGEQGAFTVQVVALKTEDAARKLLARLQRKSYRAYLESGTDAGLHRVRVGRFATRAEAERVAARLRDEEKFRPYITQ